MPPAAPQLLPLPCLLLEDAPPGNELSFVQLKREPRRNGTSLLPWRPLSVNATPAPWHPANATLLGLWPSSGLPAFLEHALLAGPAGGAGVSGVGVLVVLLIAVVVVSILVYLVVTHDHAESTEQRRDGEYCRGTTMSLPATDRTLPRGTRESLADSAPPLPMIYPDLVLPSAHTRLAVPLSPLEEREFEIDVLGLSGMPLLTVTLSGRSGQRMLQLTLHGVGKLLAQVTPDLRLLGPNGSHFATLAKDGKQFALSEPGAGRLLLSVIQERDPYEFRLVSRHRGDCAAVLRRAPGRLPAEHLEVTVSPQVDAVLVLACVLGLLVFPPNTQPLGSSATLSAVGLGPLR